MFSWLLNTTKRRAAESLPASPPSEDRSRDLGRSHVELGLQHHRADRLSEAEELYRKALAEDPENIDAAHFMGVIAHQRGNHARAVELISIALSRNASNPPAHNNLGNALAALGRRSQALGAYLDALALEPDYTDALCNLGDLLKADGKLERSAACYRRALSIAPNLPAAEAGLENALRALANRGEAAVPAVEDVDVRIRAGIALQEQGRADEAAQRFRELLAQAPESPDLHFNLGNACRDLGRLDEALASYAKALALAPDLAAAHVNMGGTLLNQGKRQQALACFRKALALEPELAEAHYNLGVASYQAGDLRSAKQALAKYLETHPDDRTALITLGEAHSRSNELDEATRCFDRVLARNPAATDAHNGLANVLRNQARHQDAIRHYEIAILNDDNPVVAYQNLLFCMMCTGTFSAADIYSRHRDFALRFEQPLLSSQTPPPNDPDPDRRLRIGYVSPEFRTNVVGHYIQPILENHDRAKFEIHGYSVGFVHDETTSRIASLVDQWHDVHLLSDAEIASSVRSDKIDVLVDLCGHGPGNRILAFARKPAPVQVNYLDYSATTGMSSIDYRLTTEYCDPSGISDRYYSELLYRLDATYWTYNPAVRPPLTELPLKSNGYVTFGSFNLYYRITAQVLDVWMRLLKSVPDSRLLVLGVPAGSTQAALLERLDRAGIARARISMHGTVSYERYNELMGTVDVALAPFPYNGATTVMDCLWNGLPVVSMKGGETFCSRLGCSVLDTMDLSSLIARDESDYIRIASDFALGTPRLEQLRRSVRERLERSPMRDFPAFTRGLERAYRSMWKKWCGRR
jgi:predicted O-linked N-acetylglucosamine transferase (SPINDLY family)